MVRRLGEVLVFDLLSALHVFYAVILTGVFCVAALPFTGSGGVFGMTFGMALFDFLFTLIGVALGVCFGIWQFRWARRLARGIIDSTPGLLIGLALLLGVAPISVVEQRLFATGGEEAPILGVAIVASRLLGLLTLGAVALSTLVPQLGAHPQPAEEPGDAAP